MILSVFFYSGRKNTNISLAMFCELLYSLCFCWFFWGFCGCSFWLLCSFVAHLIYYDMRTCLIKNNTLPLDKGETDMFQLFQKKSKVLKNWHSKAMLIDPRKTKLTIICSWELGNGKHGLQYDMYQCVNIFQITKLI